MWTMVAIALAGLVGPATAKQLVLKGTPVVRVMLSPGGEVKKEELSAGQRNEFMLLITKDGENYTWESREQKPLVVMESGAYTHFVSPSYGWIKVGDGSKLKETIEAARATGAKIDDQMVAQVLAEQFVAPWMLKHEYFYFEVITQGMLVGVYWGYADEFSPK
ncbi:MAG: hypothetical protein JW384_00601 [Nitrosomonadaceae bacterium]|nr:hypothetical protein [Nitrosomonadaceae bacterium]